MQDWNATFERNKAAAAQYEKEYDVVFFGDSITEHWAGTELSFPVEDWQKVNTVFREIFTSLGGGRVEGLALGIAGDRVRKYVQYNHHTTVRCFDERVGFD
jgi:predicted ATP-dependent serine protease